MKEATGELNTTVITVILVASLASFFFFTIWPILKNNLDSNTRCSEAICEKPKEGSSTVECYISGKENEKFQCANKG